MTEAQAIKIAKELEAMAKKHGLWATITKTNKPNLKDVVITISVKVDGRD